MSILNLTSSIRYTSSGRKRNTSAFKKARKKPEKYAEYTELLYRQEQQYKSLMKEANGAKSGNPTPRKEPLQYTGDLLVGIATMHKSNAVPVSSRQQAIDITNMAK